MPRNRRVTREARWQRGAETHAGIMLRSRMTWHLAPPRTRCTLRGVFFFGVALALIPLGALRRKEPSATIAWILTLVFLPARGRASLPHVRARPRARAGAAQARARRARARGGRAPRATAIVDHAARAGGRAARDPSSWRSSASARTSRAGARPAATTASTSSSTATRRTTSLGAAIDAATPPRPRPVLPDPQRRDGRVVRGAAHRGGEARRRGPPPLRRLRVLRARRELQTRPLRRRARTSATFLPMRCVLLQPVNLSNHRKIVVVDGEVAFTGGLNIGDEYRGQDAGRRRVARRAPAHRRARGGASCSASSSRTGRSRRARRITRREVLPAPDRRGGRRDGRHRPERPRHAHRGHPARSSSAPSPARDARGVVTTPYFVPDRGARRRDGGWRRCAASTSSSSCRRSRTTP